MPHIIVTAETSSGREVAMLAERVPVRALEDIQAAYQLAERIARGARPSPNTRGYQSQRRASALTLAPGNPPARR
jgi:hypothetical protein